MTGTAAVTGSKLSVEGLTVRYGSPERGAALDDVDLQVEPGEVVAVLGASGSGKSTLLRAIAGLVSPVAGRVVLDDHDLSGVPTHRRDIGLMFQEHALFGHLSVADNVGYGLNVAGVDRRQRQSRVAELLALVGLESFAGRHPDQLSGGEAQRVALARALAPQPRLLMLDEPLGSLDRALRETLTDELALLLRSLGQTALHVTHDQAEAFAIADRIIVLDGGKLVAQGSPAELWADPGTAFLARFLGRPNVWPIDVDTSGMVHVAGQRLGIRPDRAARPLRSGTMLVPLDAVTISEGHQATPDDLLVTVIGSRFVDGRYRVRARAGQVSVAFDSDGVPPLGSELRLRVLLDRAVPLDG